MEPQPQPHHVRPTANLRCLSANIRAYQRTYGAYSLLFNTYGDIHGDWLYKEVRGWIRTAGVPPHLRPSFCSWFLISSGLHVNIEARNIFQGVCMCSRQLLFSYKGTTVYPRTYHPPWAVVNPWPPSVCTVANIRNPLHGTGFEAVRVDPRQTYPAASNKSSGESNDSTEGQTKEEDAWEGSAKLSLARGSRSPAKDCNSATSSLFQISRSGTRRYQKPSDHSTNHPDHWA
jgi:hypothetical protein